MKKKATSKPKPKPKPAFPDVAELAVRERDTRDVVQQISAAAEEEGVSMWGLMEGFIGEVGGPKDFVVGMAKAWKGAADGTVAKQRMAEQIWRMFQSANDQREHRKKSVADLTTEELHSGIHAFLRQNGYASPDEVSSLRAENQRLKEALTKLTAQHGNPSYQQQ